MDDLEQQVRDFMEERSDLMDDLASPINPPHYQQGGIQTIDAIEAWQLGYSLGNAVKYISRAGKKDRAKEAEDLRKAIWYIERHVAQLEGGE